MTELKIGDKAPDFCLPDPERGEICLADQRGKWAILYFYPKDNTSGCTLEALEFTAAEGEFKEKNAVILAASPDSLRSHTNFREKHNLTINLLSDSEKETLKEYGAWQLKKMYGREYMGVVRSTFIIDPEGKIAHIWSKVRVKGHVEAVRAKLEELQR
ncbi:peroxiredoxin [Candidatus Bathyarchaeota archaeon]|jgi:thioredoxin-dependent peroxiredoxin|nr:peroxiredoxin [Candidatus Bathyarchaeota archaeon]MBT4321097.1 peroxiredoxin [Candidatus Bathyarchaeota archaeon]MBT4424886.1 peroxiredoxin [Candidatus Bathyarchaeota archaeon]MBT6603565.1 peroxiredoxin [Candidatus Bathyarchaeota archaeon]MBT7188391.1 peroxiredoxin [Candidatus Bathyarchaeota archaeon]